MPVPNHQSGCETKIWRAQCPSCHDPVYFFSCSCGSKVFFDSPGFPWNLHIDRCIPYLISSLIREGVPATRIRESVEMAAKKRGVPVPAAIMRRIYEEDFAKNKHETVARVFPNEDRHFIDGRILSTNLQVNFFKRLNYPDTPLTRGYLAELVREPFVEVKIRESPDSHTGICAELECFISKKKFVDLGLHVDSRVVALVIPRKIGQHAPFWVAGIVKARPNK